MQKIKDRIKWLFLTNYGRFIIGVALCATGIFSDYTTITFLNTGYDFFIYTCEAGILIITGQFLYWVIASIISYFRK